MGFFNKYPYTDFHELNLDWCIQTIKLMGDKVDNFINFNSIKYADPLAWNITTQYAANTVVVDPSTGIAYLSSQSVPNGVLITNTDYWIEIFNLSQLLTSKMYHSVSDVISDDALKTGDFAITSGFYSDGDGGAALYIVTDTGTVNNYDIFALDNGKFINLIVENAEVNLMQLGAHNDGSVDDASLIQYALDTYNHIIVPEGTFLISSTLTAPSGKTLSGKFDTFDRDLNKIKTLSNITMIRLGSNVNVSYLTFEHENDNSNGIIDITGSRYVVLDHVKLEHGAAANNAYGIYTNPGSSEWNGYIYLSYVYASEYKIGLYANPTLITCANCKMTDCADFNAHIYGSGSVASFSACDLTRNDHGPALKSESVYDISCSGCYFEDIKPGDLIVRTNLGGLSLEGSKAQFSYVQPTIADPCYWSRFDPDHGATPKILRDFNNGLDGDNLVLNGDFEFGTFGWNIGAQANGVVQNCTGEIGYEKELYLPFSGGANVISNLRYLPKGKYTLSFWIKFANVPDMSDVFFDCYVRSNDGTITYAKYTFRSMTAVEYPDNVWKLITISFTSDGTIANPELYIRCNAKLPDVHLAGVNIRPGITAGNTTSNHTQILNKLYMMGTDSILYEITVDSNGITVTPA